MNEHNTWSPDCKLLSWEKPNGDDTDWNMSGCEGCGIAPYDWTEQ